jgi:aspartyl protease family protein
MTDPRAPWNDPAPPSAPKPTPEPPSRPWVCLVLAGGVAALVFALVKANPGAVRGADDWSRVAYSAILLLLLASGAARLGRAGLKRHLRDIAIWVAIFAVLALGYANRDVFQDASQRLQMAFGGGRPVVLDEQTLVVPRDESGHFLIIGRVNGQPVRFLVDTGASDTVLSPDDARRLGVDTAGLTYGYPAETANGVGYAAAHTVDSLEVGPIRKTDFRVMVNRAPMSASLLGMSFLGGLESYQVRGDRLTLTWRAAKP